MTQKRWGLFHPQELFQFETDTVTVYNQKKFFDVTEEYQHKLKPEIKSASSAKHQTFETLVVDMLVVAGNFFSTWLSALQPLGQICLQNIGSGRCDVSIKDR